MERNTQGAYLLTLTETIMAIDLKECNARQLDSLEEMFSSALNQVRQKKRIGTKKMFSKLNYIYGKRLGWWYCIHL